MVSNQSYNTAVPTPLLSLLKIVHLDVISRDQFTACSHLHPADGMMFHEVLCAPASPTIKYYESAIDQLVISLLPSPNIWSPTRPQHLLEKLLLCSSDALIRGHRIITQMIVMADVGGICVTMHVGDPLKFGHICVAGANVFGLQLVFVDGGSSRVAHG